MGHDELQRIVLRGAQRECRIDGSVPAIALRIRHAMSGTDTDDDTVRSLAQAQQSLHAWPQPSPTRTASRTHTQKVAHGVGKCGQSRPDPSSRSDQHQQVATSFCPKHSLDALSSADMAFCPGRPSSTGRAISVVRPASAGRLGQGRSGRPGSAGRVRGDDGARGGQRPASAGRRIVAASYANTRVAWDGRDELYVEVDELQQNSFQAQDTQQQASFAQMQRQDSEIERLKQIIVDKEAQVGMPCCLSVHVLFP